VLLPDERLPRIVGSRTTALETLSSSFTLRGYMTIHYHGVYCEWFLAVNQAKACTNPFTPLKLTKYLAVTHRHTYQCGNQNRNRSFTVSSTNFETDLKTLNSKVNSIDLPIASSQTLNELFLLHLSRLLKRDCRQSTDFRALHRSLASPYLYHNYSISIIATCQGHHNHLHQLVGNQETTTHPVHSSRTPRTLAA
jgi:hypothetical protein